MTTVTEISRKTTLVPKEPDQFNERQPNTIRIYPVSNYTFTTKDIQPEEDSSVVARLARLQSQYEEHGMRRSCEAVMLCHDHGFPYVLLLQIGTFCKLPGDYLGPGQDEMTALKEQLTNQLAPAENSTGADDEENYNWDVDECIGQWWRPNFETHLYPYIPPHCTRPKECKKVYLIRMPGRKVLSVPRNMKLIAVPLFELYDNAARYGGQLASLPLHLSRFNMEFVDNEGNIIGKMPSK
ncbi:hypothetical protein TRVA0_038S00210 [Trichomonascus vanleenenianus]|uniref:cleavage and polyadenylation specificity factor subunit 5 n=1 Tax=Trichomonascus vanleenenianus TaxID=2268995 RepID=UPI003EC9C583